MSRLSDDSPSPWLGGRPLRRAVAALLALFAVFTLAELSRLRSGRPAVAPVMLLLGSDRFAPGRTELYPVLVFNALDGAPIAHADVHLLCVLNVYDKARDDAYTTMRTLGRGETSAMGEVTFEAPLPPVCLPPGDGGKQDLSTDHPAVLVRVDVEGVELEMVLPLQQDLAAATKALVATDKPSYQPGQTMRIRALLIGPDRRPLANTQTTLEIGDPQGNKVFKRALRTSAFGNVYADFELADEVNLGPYTVSATGGGIETQQVVEVKRYALSKFELAVDTDSRVVPPGSKLGGQVRATWLFGKPVVGAAAVVWMTKRGSDAEMGEKAEFKTGELGPLAFPVSAPEESGDYDLHTSVTLEGGESRTAVLPISVTVESLRVELVPDGGPLVEGMLNRAFVLVSTPDGTPVRARVKIAPGGPEIETDDSGIASVAFVPNRGQKLRALAGGSAGPEGEFALPPLAPDRDAAVLVASDRTEYVGGDSVRIVARTQAPSGVVYLDLAKAEAVLASGACRPQGGVCELTLPLPQDASGLVRIRALHPKDGKAGFASRLVLVRHRNDLNLRVDTDRPLYAPADVAALDLYVTTQDGAPVAAALSLAGVDEAVFAIAEARPDLQTFFLGIGRDLAAEAQVGKKEYAFRRRSPIEPGPLAPQAPLFRGRIADVLAPNPGEGRLARPAMLAALAAAAPRPASLEADMAHGTTWVEALDHRETYELWGRMVLLPGVLFLIGAGVVLAYGFGRVRRGKLALALTDEEAAEWKKVSRGLLTAWLLQLLVPFPVLSMSILAFDEGLHLQDTALIATLSLVGGACVAGLAALSVRALSRVYRTRVGRTLPGLRQAGWLLPVSAVLFVAAIMVPTVSPKRVARAFLEDHAATAVAVCLIVIAAQLVFGVLSVLRNATAHETTPRRRAWLLLSRAGFVGLPVSVGVLGFLGCKLWVVSDYGAKEAVEYAAENKEEGTGTRAKGEEDIRSGAGSGEPDLPKARLRADFPETLLWAPEVLTDVRGHARVDVPLADSITTWRLSASAISPEGGMGTATTEIRVRARTELGGIVAK